MGGKQLFHGLSREYPGIVPGLSRHFPEISWEFCFRVSLFAQEKGNTQTNLTPTHSRDNPEKLFMFIVILSPSPKEEARAVRVTLCHDNFCPVFFPMSLLTFADCKSFNDFKAKCLG